MVVNIKVGVLRVVGTVGGRSWPSGTSGQISRAGARGLPGKHRKVVTWLVADAVGIEMQSTDLGNKESGKIWHRKPSPATREG